MHGGVSPWPVMSKSGPPHSLAARCLLVVAEVADMEVDKVVDMEVDKMVDMVADMEVDKVVATW